MTATDELPGVLVVVQALEALGLAVEKKSRTHWQSQCPNPEHADSEGSLCIDVKPYYDGKMIVAIRCPVCRWKGSDVCNALGLPVRILFGNHERYRSDDRPTYTAPLTEDLLRSHRKALQESPDRLAYLHDHRGLTLATIERFELGYDGLWEKFVLPVRNARGALVNFRQYDPGAETGKMKNASGRGSPARLYPLPLQRRWQWLLVVEGEWDALLARQHNLPAVTGTEGAGTWLPKWSAALTGRKVAFAFDCDTAGREHAAKHAFEVVKVAAAVKVLDLGLGDGEDVSDWFLKYGRSSKDLRKLISATPALDAGGGGAGD